MRSRYASGPKVRGLNRKVDRRSGPGSLRFAWLKFDVNPFRNDSENHYRKKSHLLGRTFYGFYSFIDGVYEVACIKFILVFLNPLFDYWVTSYFDKFCDLFVAIQYFL